MNRLVFAPIPSGAAFALRIGMRLSAFLPVLASVYLLGGCFGYANTNGNGAYYGGGGIGLFVVILVLALVFGKKKR